MDPLHVGIALGPLGVYLLLLARINLRRRPLVTTGGRDLAALGIGLCGLLVAGPMEFLMPEAAVARWGPLAWTMMILLYALGLSLVILTLRPRLVVYNISAAQLREIAGDVATTMDPAAGFAGDVLHVPALGITASIEETASMRNVTIAAAGPTQNHHGWRRFEVALSISLAACDVPRNSRGYSFLLFGTMILFGVFWHLTRQPEAVAQQFQEMMRLGE